MKNLCKSFKFRFFVRTQKCFQHRKKMRCCFLILKLVQVEMCAQDWCWEILYSNSKKSRHCCERYHLHSQISQVRKKEDEIKLNCGSTCFHHTSLIPWDFVAITKSGKDPLRMWIMLKLNGTTSQKWAELKIIIMSRGFVVLKKIQDSSEIFTLKMNTEKKFWRDEKTSPLRQPLRRCWASWIQN